MDQEQIRELAVRKNLEAEVYAQYKTIGSKLRNTIRTKDARDGETTFIPVGNGPAYRQPVECPMADYYFGNWVKKIDDLYFNATEMIVIAKAGAYAIGRKTDELIIDAMSGADRRVVVNGGLDQSAINMAMAGDRRAEYARGAGEWFAVVGWKQWSDLFNIHEFANADYVSSDELPWKSTQAKIWLNTLWMPSSGLPKINGVRTCFWYHKAAVGHAIGEQVFTDITRHSGGYHVAWFVNHRLAHGACLIDAAGVVAIKCKEE